MSTNSNESSTTSPLGDLTLSQVEERVLQLARKGSADSYQIGQLYNYVVDKSLALTGGFKDAEDFFRQRVGMISQSSLTMYGAVASKFTEAATVKYGMSKLYTLLTYAKRASIKDLDGSEPGDTLVSVPLEDGALTRKPFAECSLEDLRQAVKHQGSSGKPLSELDETRVKRYQDSLDRQLPAKHGIRVVARREGDTLVLSVRNVPESKMDRLVAALIDAPAPEAVTPPAVATEPRQVAPPAQTPPPAEARPAVSPAPPHPTPVPHPPAPANGGTGLRGLLRRQLQRAVGT